MIDKLNQYIQKYFKSKKQFGKFGRGKFYQTLDGVVSSGQRPTKQRIDEYKILTVINKDTNILDIGSNCGFISISLAAYAHNVLGIEPSKELINIANTARDIVGYSNCNFKRAAFADFETEDKYELILSLAVHHWVKIPFKNYIEKIIGMLSDGGYLMIESHDLKKIDSKFHLKKKYLLSKFELIHHGKIKDDKRIKREFLLLKLKEG